MTLEVSSELEDALELFISNLDDECKIFISNNISAIYAIFDQARMSNLRVLERTLWDFQRLYMVLGEKHRKNNNAMVGLLKLFLALSFEFKLARIQASDFEKRLEKVLVDMYRKEKSEAPAAAICDANKRYPNLLTDETILTDDILVDIITRGSLDTAKINSCLDKSAHFQTDESEPAWVTLWYLFDRTEEEFNDAYQKVEQQFIDREFSEIGEILHVFGLRLWLSSLGASEKTKETIYAECCSYVDDLYKQGRLQPRRRGRVSGQSFEGYRGLGIYEKDSEEYNRLSNYLFEKSYLAFEGQYPEFACQLLCEMREDSDLFFRRINWTESKDSIYYDIPVLETTTIEDFCGTFFTLHPTSQRKVLNSIEKRYTGPAKPSDTKWLAGVHNRLEYEADSLPPMSKSRLKLMLKSMSEEVGLEPGNSGASAMKA